jgi:transketolase
VLSEAELPKALTELETTGRRMGAVAGCVGKSKPPTNGPPRVVHQTRPLPTFEEALIRVGMEEALRKRMISTRAAYGAALAALGDADPRITVLDGDVSNSTFANRFAKAHPERFFEAKIAEQNMISVAVGLAAAGKIPFVSSFAKFIARATDQIDMAAISRANVKIVGSHAGASLAADGPSQMGLSDLAYFRSLTTVEAKPGQPACRVFHPADGVAAYRLTEFMAHLEGMCYLRTHRPEAPILYSADEPFTLDGVKSHARGDRLTLVSCGYLLHTVLHAARRLAQQGMNCGIFDVYSLPCNSRPIFDDARAARGNVLVVEDNYAGGLHAALAEAAAAAGDIRVHGLTPRRIPKSARTAEEIFSYIGVGIEAIMERAIALAEE